MEERTKAESPASEPTFAQIVERSLALLERRGRVSHTALRLEFDLDDALLAALREELVSVLGAAEDDGRVLAVHRPTQAVVAAAPPKQAAPDISPERAAVTVLLCDLASTDGIDALDAAARGAAAARLHTICAEVARRLRGHIQPWVSDGVAIFFGHPRAAEDDALRAVRCGHELLRCVEGASAAVTRELGIELSVRIGIATGPRGDAGGAFGDTPRVAGRAQDRGAADRVTVDAATQSLTTERFGFEQLSGDEHFELLGPRDHVAAGPRAPAPLVGRTGERALLQALAERASAGTLSAVLLRGEAGIGKSRLVDALGTGATADLGMQVLACRCSPYHRGSALHPLLEGLRRHWQLDGTDASARLGRRARIAGDDRAVALLAGLLGVAAPDGVALEAMGPRRRRREGIAALVQALAGEARSTPLMLVIEDLHWVDPSMLELVDALLDGARALPLLIVLTARAEFRLPARPALQRIELPRLEHEELVALVEHVAAEGALPDGVVQEIAVRSAGSPLLAEELTHAVLATQDSGSTIAATLYGCLMARLDRDSTARSVARLAATIGREFDVSLLQEEGQIDRSALDWGLERLVYEDVIAPTAPGSYAFRHALLQDAARSSLRREPLRGTNRRVARTLLERFPHVAAAEPERIARHFEYAGDLPDAVAHWQRAGVQALDGFALHEAAGHFERALELVARTADGPERQSAELTLRVLAGTAHATTQGWAASSAATHLERAAALGEKLAPSAQLARPLLGIAAYRLASGRVEDALKLARAQVAVAARAADPALVLEAECEAGIALVHLGRHRDALAHLARAVELYDPARDREHADRHGRNPAAIALTHRGLALACRDARDGARDAFSKAAELLRARRHPYSQAWMHCGAATAALICGEVAVVSREAELALRIATEEGFGDWLGQGSVLHGWARVCAGDHDGGIDELRRGIAMWTATGARIMRPFLQGLHADALHRSGEPELGLLTVDEALPAVSDCARWYEPELHRLRAELLLSVGDRPRAQRSARTAVSLSRRTSTAAWERRATVTLARAGAVAPPV